MARMPWIAILVGFPLAVACCAVDVAKSAETVGTRPFGYERVPEGSQPPAPSTTADRVPSTRSPLPLPSKGDPRHGRKAGTRSSTSLTSMLPVAGSLALVVGVFLLLAWGMRRATPAGRVVLPGEVFEVLGHAPLAGRQQAQLLRCGNKLILVSVTSDGAETLGEITDSAEVDRLSGLCRASQPNSATAAFRHVFQQIAASNSDTKPVTSGVPIKE